ncbi:hypothetical protein ACIQVL_30565 [Streptomyces sp. NPDC090499]|uniref:hypothetical protein n=1 Tax=Streptomyces sp. NPDC090499 TaxID=3365965 RepID=UPI0038280F29
MTLFLRHVGFVRGDELDVAESDLIEWHGGGPEVWPRQGVDRTAGRHRHPPRW